MLKLNSKFEAFWKHNDLQNAMISRSKYFFATDMHAIISFFNSPVTTHYSHKIQKY